MTPDLPTSFRLWKQNKKQLRQMLKMTHVVSQHLHASNPAGCRKSRATACQVSTRFHLNFLPTLSILDVAFIARRLGGAYHCWRLLGIIVGLFHEIRISKYLGVQIRGIHFQMQDLRDVDKNSLIAEILYKLIKII